MRKFKKVTAMVCALMMSAMLFAALPAGAAEQVTNGDFESVDVNGKAEGWTLAGSGEVITDGGNHYFALKAKSASIISSPVDIVGGGTYCLKFNKNVPNDQLRVYFRWYNEEDKHLSDVNTLYPAGTSGEWKEQTYVQTAPEDAAFLRFYFIVHNYSEGNPPTCIDDVTVTRVDNQQGELLANGSLEELENGTPKGFTGGTVVNDTVHTAGGKALKLTNTEAGATQTVKAKFLGTTGKRIEVSAYMNLTELDASADGVILEVYDGTTKKAATSYFKAVNDVNGTAWGWRKMMLTFTGVANELEIRVTLSGIGTVYLDDFSAVTNTNLIANGDMEGLTSDVQPTWWEAGNKNYKFGDHLNVAKDGTGNTYLVVSQGSGDTKYASTIIKKITLTAGVRYKFHMRFNTTGTWAGTYNFSNSLSASSILLKKTSDKDGNRLWGEHTYYFTPKTTQAYTLTIGKRDKSALVPYFDDISLEPVAEQHTLAFYDVTGQETEDLTTGTFTAKYSGFGTDYTNVENNLTVQMLVAKYLKSGDKLTLESVSIKEGSAEKVNGKASIVIADVAGEVPLELSMEVTVPAEGDYIYKAFAWDKNVPLRDLCAAAKLK